VFDSYLHLTKGGSFLSRTSFFSPKTVRSIAINNGQGAVLPSETTVQNNRYQPYSRPIFIYINERSAREKPEVKAFVEYYLKNANRLTQKVGYVPLSEESYHIAEVHFYEGKIGTVFAGEPQPGISMGQLLRKQAIF
jgi:phosphate transport system substrate-binding protein